MTSKDKVGLGTKLLATLFYPIFSGIRQLGCESKGFIQSMKELWRS